MLKDSNFQLQPGTRALFGVGAVARLPKLLKPFGVKKALIVTDAGLVAAGIAERVGGALKEAGVEVEVFDGVEANPHAPNVDAGADRLRALGDAAVIALGGGSSMDAAKAIALEGPNGGSIRDFLPGCRPEKPGAPLFAVPTTAGTGSETNIFGVITDPELGRKLIIGHASVLPKAVVLDPELGTGAPASVTAPCGMDVMTHAIEAYSCTRTNPYTDAAALQAISMATRHLPDAFDDGSNLEARSQMLLAAHLAGIAFTSSGLGICHAMGHPLSARLGAAHGQTLATMLPHVMRFNMDVVAPRYADVARAMGADESGASVEQNARRAVDAVEKLRARVKTDRSISDLGGSPDLVPTLIEDALADVVMMTTPKPPSPDDLKTLFEQAM